MDGERQVPAYVAVPSVVFTIPSLATVGKTGAQARAEHLDVRIEREDTSGWYSNRRVGETAAMFKVLVDKQSDLVVGAHLLGPHAEEIINLFALAMRHRIPARALKEMQYAYPSASSDISYMV